MRPDEEDDFSRMAAGGEDDFSARDLADDFTAHDLAEDDPAGEAMREAPQEPLAFVQHEGESRGEVVRDPAPRVSSSATAAARPRIRGAVVLEQALREVVRGVRAVGLGALTPGMRGAGVELVIIVGRDGKRRVLR